MAADPGLPWTPTPTGLRLTLRLTPRGGRDALGGLRRDAEGQTQMLARVSSAPVDGAANAALIKLLAKTLQIPKSAVTLIAGETSRIKTLELSGDAAALERSLSTLIRRDG